jgi:hypothetical protein
VLVSDSSTKLSEFLNVLSLGVVRKGLDGNLLDMGTGESLRAARHHG